MVKSASVAVIFWVSPAGAEDDDPLSSAAEELAAADEDVAEPDDAELDDAEPASFEPPPHAVRPARAAASPSTADRRRSRRGRDAERGTAGLLPTGWASPRASRPRPPAGSRAATP